MSTRKEPSIESLAEGQAELASLLTGFIAEQRQFNASVDRRFEQVDRRFEQIERRFEQVDRRFEQVERRLETIQSDIAEVKGGHARVETIRRADVIASAMNLFYERTLSASELDDMVRENPDISVARNEAESFKKADMVIKAKDGSRLTNYIAVEISYTADERDTNRAIRNAELLTKFTGRQAHAVIASVRNDYATGNLICNGFIRWYEIPRRNLQVE